MRMTTPPSPTYRCQTFPWLNSEGSIWALHWDNSLKNLPSLRPLSILSPRFLSWQFHLCPFLCSPSTKNNPQRTLYSIFIYFCMFLELHYCTLFSTITFYCCIYVKHICEISPLALSFTINCGKCAFVVLIFAFSMEFWEYFIPQNLSVFMRNSACFSKWISQCFSQEDKKCNFKCNKGSLALVHLWLNVFDETWTLYYIILWINTP